MTSSQAKPSALQRAARRLGVATQTMALKPGAEPRTWRLPSGEAVRVERAAMAAFEAEGWRGYAGEGGLLLNLIKALSFASLAPRHASIYVEALYAGNVAFDEDRFPVGELIEQIGRTTSGQLGANLELWFERNPASGLYQPRGDALIHSYFPGLQHWMFVELHQVLGVQRLTAIARRFGDDPYQFRRGWPDLTLWKDGKVRFVEVKAPGDRIQASQKTIIEHFVQPLGLDLTLLEILPVAEGA